ncbi:metallophosphoesterase family protein [Halosimplex aquaticum]|uniref:Phosphoesterase n=1 Tax=Halosimplex aquaticum TaxID=3026162 RepID=A0ABD5Y2H4_9EURY|nr:metallophosphoesterase family protein [Halosimplex aquaticum]
MDYLVLADVHANLPALEAVLDRESDRDAVLFLGDAVGTGPHPDEVLTTLSRLSGGFVSGNHDRSVLDTRPERPPPNSRDFERWTSAQLSPENRRFLAGLADERRVATAAGPVRLHHGDFAVEREGLDWDRRGWPDTDPEVYRELADRYDEDVVLFGHSHVQFETTAGGTRFVNPGSVGQHRLGEVLACYAVVEDGDVDLGAVDYDVERTIADLEALPLADEYVEARKLVYTEGRLPDDPPMRDFEPLRERGYR